MPGRAFARAPAADHDPNKTPTAETDPMAPSHDELNALDLSAVDVPAIVTDAAGNPHINSAKYGAKLAWFAPDKFPLTMPATLNANDRATILLSKPGVKGGDVEFRSFLATSDQRFAVRLYSQSLNFWFMRKPIANTLVFGTAFIPSRLPASIYELGDGGALVADITQTTALLNNIRFVGVGRRFVTEAALESIEARRAQFLSTRVRPFWLAPREGPEVALGPGASTTLTFDVPSNGDFLMLAPLDDSSSTTGLEPSFTGEIVEGLNDYHLMGTSTPNTNAQIPWRPFVAAFSKPLLDSNFTAAGLEGAPQGELTHLVARNSQIIVNFTNTDAGTITLRSGFRGLLLCYPPAPGKNTNNSEEMRKQIAKRSVHTQLSTIFKNTIGQGS